jgi:hypothetical protein
MVLAIDWLLHKRLLDHHSIDNDSISICPQDDIPILGDNIGLLLALPPLGDDYFSPFFLVLRLVSGQNKSQLSSYPFSKRTRDSWTAISRNLGPLGCGYTHVVEDS